MAIDRLRLRRDAALAEQARLRAQQRRAAGGVDARNATARLRSVSARVVKYQRLVAALDPRTRGLAR